MRQTEPTWDAGSPVYGVVVEGVVGAPPNGPRQRLVRVGPRKLEQCLGLRFGR